MDLLAFAAICGTLIGFTAGWLVGRESQRKFNRRMSDIEKRKRDIAWPIGHKGE